MKVRTGEQHTYPGAEAQVDQFVVSPLPILDHAARALREAQDAYFTAWPQARKHARDYIWTITKREGL